METEEYDERKQRGSAGVSPAVFGVPPNTSSPDTHRTGRRETRRPATGTVALPNCPAAAPSQSRSNQVKPIRLAFDLSNRMQLPYHERLAKQSILRAVRPGQTGSNHSQSRRTPASRCVIAVPWRLCVDIPRTRRNAQSQRCKGNRDFGIWVGTNRQESQPRKLSGLAHFVHFGSYSPRRVGPHTS